jgi:hypothetical protein
MAENEEGAAAQRPSGEDEEEVREEEESAKAMEAEVPHPEGYPDSGQEPPA